MSSLPSVFVDDSGNTGPDLLNSVQTVFVLGSYSGSSEDAETLLEAGGLDMSREAKFATLSRSSAGQTAIAAVIERCQPETAKAVALHKEFTVVAQLVDHLLEPMFLEHGLGFYVGALNLATANALFLGLPTIIGDDRMRELEGAFVGWVRRPTPDSAESLRVLLQALRESTVGTPFEPMTALLSEAELTTEPLTTDLDILANTLDPAVPSLTVMIDAWSNQIAGPFDLVHDESSIIRRWAPIFERMTDASGVPRRSIGYGDRSVTLPFTATGIQFVESHGEAGVRVADLVAGAIRYFGQTSIREVPDTSFRSSLIDAGIEDLLIHVVWPNHEDLALDPTALPKS